LGHADQIPVTIRPNHGSLSFVHAVCAQPEGLGLVLATPEVVTSLRPASLSGYLWVILGKPKVLGRLSTRVGVCYRQPASLCVGAVAIIELPEWLRGLEECGRSLPCFHFVSWLPAKQCSHSSTCCKKGDYCHQAKKDALCNQGAPLHKGVTMKSYGRAEQCSSPI
jgi:hypothetical protein